MLVRFFCSHFRYSVHFKKKRELVCVCLKNNGKMPERLNISQMFHIMH